MKNWTVLSMILLVICIAALAVSTTAMKQATKELKRAQEDRIQERTRQYSEILPIGVSIHVRISDGQEMKIGTIGKTEIAMESYRHAILRWENSEGSFISVIHEKDLQTANPAWFKALVSANGGSITLNDQECSPPYRVHNYPWQTEMRN